MKTDVELLKAALLGYEQQLANINEKIGAIRQQLRGKPATEPKVIGVPSTAKRHISAAGRERIAAAQRERWKKIHAVANGKKKARTAA
jgi:hypothetical protein